MRLLAIVMSILLLACTIGFIVTNLHAQVDITLWKTDYPATSLHLVVVFSLLAGILYAGIIGAAQGVQAWMINRRLVREIQKLETELNYLRTQPSTRSRPEPDVVEDADGSPPPEPSSGQDRLFPSAPVYGAEEDDDPDDDVYSGGRAV